jgi:hypothetical protein
MPWPKGKPSWNAGKSKETDERIKNQSLKLKGKDIGFNKGSTHSQEWKDGQSQRMRSLYNSGWEPVCGRCKKYDYTSPIAGQVKLDGTWELKVAKFFDSVGLQWKRNKRRFDYVKPNGKSSTYQPDFFIEDWNCYIEVKGYETELDRAKWSQFTEKLKIIKSRDIGELDEWLKSASC